MRVESRMPAGMTMVPNEFIDRYMAGANGEFVKVYLCLLRLEDKAVVTESLLADRLNMTERDVARALTYWNEAGILSIDLEDNGADLHREAAARTEKMRTSGVAGLEGPITGIGRAKEPAAKEEAKTPERHSLKPSEIEQLKNENEDFDEAIVAIEHYLGRTLNPTQLEKFAFFYRDLGFSGELLEYLVEYCVGNDHKNMSYIESTALGWHSEGKDTVEKAKAGAAERSAGNRAIRKALGMTDSSLNDEEQKIADRWLKEWKMPLEMVVEACHRTVRVIHKPSLQYTDSILTKWHDQGISSLQELKEKEAEKKAEEKKETEKPSAGKQKKKPEFDFEQRHFDYDSLLRHEA